MSISLSDASERIERFLESLAADLRAVDTDDLPAAARDEFLADVFADRDAIRVVLTAAVRFGGASSVGRDERLLGAGSESPSPVAREFAARLANRLVEHDPDVGLEYLNAAAARRGLDWFYGVFDAVCDLDRTSTDTLSWTSIGLIDSSAARHPRLISDALIVVAEQLDSIDLHFTQRSAMRALRELHEPLGAGVTIPVPLRHELTDALLTPPTRVAELLEQFARTLDSAVAASYVQALAATAAFDYPPPHSHLFLAAIDAHHPGTIDHLAARHPSPQPTGWRYIDGAAALRGVTFTDDLSVEWARADVFSR